MRNLEGSKKLLGIIFLNKCSSEKFMKVVLKFLAKMPKWVSQFFLVFPIPENRNWEKEVSSEYLKLNRESKSLKLQKTWNPQFLSAFHVTIRRQFVVLIRKISREIQWNLAKNLENFPHVQFFWKFYGC